MEDLGRIVIPKESRRTLRTREGDPLEIYTEKDGGVIFRKYSPMGDLMGCVMLLLGEGDGPLAEADQGLAKIAAGFLGRQMES